MSNPISTAAIDAAGPVIVVAMDFDNADDCLRLADRLDPSTCRLKVGKELFTSAGPAVVEALMQKGFDVFLDLKFHDIPNTTAKAVKAAAELGVWMVNVHASGGRKMMETCRNILTQHAGPTTPLLIGVTVLTSMEQSDLIEAGITASPKEHVLRLAKLAQASGLDGVVCSALEAQLLKTELGQNFALVTPGIRPADASNDDQKRILTPKQALQQGSDYLVIGRPITQHADPGARCRDILSSIV